MKGSVCRKIAVMLCAAILLSVLCACGAPKTPGNRQTTLIEQTTEQLPAALSWKSSSISCYNRLDAKGKAVYEEILQAIRARKASIAVDLKDYSNLVYDKIYFFHVLPDNPELIYVRAGGVLHKSDMGSQHAYFEFQYASEDEISQRSAAMEDVFEQIRATLPDGADDFQKAKAVYNYLIKTCEYDKSYTGNSLEENTTTASYADGALVDRLAVCTGYSRAFKLMMDKFGIECTCVDNDEHEWNMVKIEDNYYHIDTTWADTETFGKNRYFCVSDAQIYRDRQRAQGDLPVCNSDY